MFMTTLRVRRIRSQANVCAHVCVASRTAMEL